VMRGRGAGKRRECRRMGGGRERKRGGEGEREREREREKIRADPVERSSPSSSFFFPCRVITSLSARQLRRKKSSNNHIYGAAASLRCIDPRRWPRGEGGRLGKRGKSGGSSVE